MSQLSSILLVDDDTTTNFLHEHLLRKHQLAADVQVATSGEAALALLTQPVPYAPSLLLLDIAMPGMGGIGFLEAFRHLPPAQQAATVIVVLTTSLDPRDLARLLALPIAGVVTKPLTLEKVQSLLEVHFAPPPAAA